MYRKLVNNSLIRHHCRSLFGYASCFPPQTPVKTPNGTNLHPHPLQLPLDLQPPRGRIELFDWLITSYCRTSSSVYQCPSPSIQSSTGHDLPASLVPRRVSLTLEPEGRGFNPIGSPAGLLQDPEVFVFGCHGGRGLEFPPLFNKPLEPCIIFRQRRFNFLGFRRGFTGFNLNPSFFYRQLFVLRYDCISKHFPFMFHS